MPQLLYTQERNPLYPLQMEINFIFMVPCIVTLS
jgi:hypothetical protein